MDTKHISFSEMFDTDKTGIYRVVIPKIQRAYAQGRSDARTTRTRERFLASIHEHVSSNRLMTLDFIYGNNDNGVLTPLDGQQRLTTLFLMHWYAAKKGGVEAPFLSNFTYETRYSARDFCTKLIAFTPQWKGKLSEEIMDQAWFPLDWSNDATVESMLVMLDAIDERFANIDNLWDALGNIKFHFLPIEQMGLTDDIYIKMNSRGKPLTDFEHFKAEFEKALKAVDKDMSTRITRKIDVDWTDMLWPYKGDNGIIDDEFLRYFRFVCDILCYQSGGSPRDIDEFALIDEYFRGPNAKSNFETLEKFFGCWIDVDPTELFNEFIAVGEHTPGKILMRQSNQRYLFLDCLQDYADMLGNRNRRFTLNQIILLYAFIVYLLHKESITSAQFGRRLRIIYNLVLNSRDEISDSENRTSGNRMPAILKQVRNIVLEGEILDIVTLGDEQSPRPNFNNNQLAEEKEKLQFTTQYPHLAESLFMLEDHDLLRGQIGIVGLEHPERFDRFAALFDCDWDNICCALISTADYGRRYRGWRLDLGTPNKEFASAWRELFDKSNAASGYEALKDTLGKILEIDNISDAKLIAISSQFMADCEAQSLYPWRYYYVKYPSIRLDRYGRYTQYPDTPYVMLALYTQQKESQNAFSVFLNELGSVNRDYCGWRITINNDGDYIACENSAYVLYSSEGKVLNSTAITQNAEGIDEVDRILFGKSHYQEICTPKLDAQSPHQDSTSAT